MNKIKILLLLVLVCLTMCSCGKENIVGNWVSSDGEASLAFDKEGKIVVDGKYIGEYSVYDDGKMAIDIDTATFDEVYDVNMSAEYKIEDGILQITDIEKGDTFLYYQESDIGRLVNEKYKKQGENSEEYMPIILSKPDAWELHLEGTELEGVINESQLRSDSVQAIAMAKDEILPLYENSVIDGKNKYDCTCLSAMYVWDKVCYEIVINVDKVGATDRYVVNPNNGEIYMMSGSEGLIRSWDGTIKGKSIMEKI